MCWAGAAVEHNAAMGLRRPVSQKKRCHKGFAPLSSHRRARPRGQNSTQSAGQVLPLNVKQKPSFNVPVEGLCLTRQDSVKTSPAKMYCVVTRSLVAEVDGCVLDIFVLL